MVGKVLGAQADSITFANFKRFAGEAKLHKSSVNYIKRGMGISDLNATNITVRLLLQFILSFKRNLWIPRCAKIKEWEKARNITSSVLRERTIRRQRCERKRIDDS